MLGELTEEAARRFGDQAAYVGWGGWSLSYAELDRLSDEAAAGLRAAGVGEGDVVALALPPIPEYPVAYLAAAKVGAITTGINPRLAPPEREAILAVAEPRLVVATLDLAPTTTEVAEVVPAEHADEVLADLRRSGRGSDSRTIVDDPDRPAVIVFTSGTTGMPKGALFCNRQLAAVCAIDVGDRWGGGGAALVSTSTAHLGFMTKLPGNLRQGGTSYFTARWKAAEALRFTAEHRLTSTGGIPTQVALMLAVPDFDSYDLSSVRTIVIGGGSATPSLVEDARRRFQAPLLVRYSCTEAGIGLGTRPDDPPEDAVVSVGRPQPGVELVLLDGSEGAVPAGEVGEVCLRSPAVMSEYWHDPEATRAAFTGDGFVRTGDLGWVDEQGRLHLAGRSKEMYVRGGYNVYPNEVEAVLSEHPDIVDVAVVPRPDTVMGEIGVAVAVVRPEGAAVTLEGIRSFARPRLASYKLPEDLRVVDALPLTAMDKLDRRALARLVAGSEGTRDRMG